ncbi:trehalase-domain-containing protein [Aspergillus avenaceus]|uniref:Trehalase n=1 Tax=Aspergillus avenaceus TaxID=36643 RepID=A0A5N6TQK2_ASPAV|nr:trehalase-domain-containing protein [Aspergillus avenaceus]
MTRLDYSSHPPVLVSDGGFAHHGGSAMKRAGRGRGLSFSFVQDTLEKNPRQQLSPRNRPRRGSVDPTQINPREFLIPVHGTLRTLLEQEDTDGDCKITVEDLGPKVLSLGSIGSDGIRRYEVRGTYALSNLLQELTLAGTWPSAAMVVDERRLHENPVERLSRFIRTVFWESLTRRIDVSSIARVARDPKDWTETPRGRIYVPPRALDQFEYYSQFSKDHPEATLDVILLPKVITPSYVRDLNSAPGLLALAVEKSVDPTTGREEVHGLPFPVPGARFNELYGWDSYFIILGLLRSGREDLARSTILNFCFCIDHYGKILNANRTYYLCRSHPPFLTDMALKTYEQIKHQPKALDLLRTATQAAIKEYHTVWNISPRLDPVTRLAKYRADGLGVPPETEKSHFTQVLQPYAVKHGCSVEEFISRYNSAEICEPELDEYFLHDRSLRESGHDTTYRLEHVCADLVTVDLNSLLYKYEKDISFIIRTYFADRFDVPSEWSATGSATVDTSAAWDRRARSRKARMTRYLWNEEKSIFLDYNTQTRQQMPYESVTTLWPLWAGLASPQQAAALINESLPKFEHYGGLAACTESSRGRITLERPNRQWDYPYGWAPHQMLAWTGLLNYGYQEDAQRLAYKWVHMMTKAFVEFNGVVVEKYDVTRPDGSHKVDAEYGNQGADFRGVPREGFGWANASYVCGLDLMNAHMKRALGACVPYDLLETALYAE